MAKGNNQSRRSKSVTRTNAPAGAVTADALAQPGLAFAGHLGRSGGVVDAPGKKHRKPMPADPGASQAASQATKLRAAMPMVKTNRLRGRG